MYNFPSGGSIVPSFYQNVFTILARLREHRPKGVYGSELRRQDMQDEEFAQAVTYLTARKAVESNNVKFPCINRHFYLANASSVSAIQSPADLLEQDLIAFLGDHDGESFDPAQLPNPLSSDRTLLQMVLRRLDEKGLVKVLPDTEGGRPTIINFFVHPQMLEAKHQLDYGIQQAAKTMEVIVQNNIQIANGTGNVQINGDRNAVTNTVKVGVDLAQVIQAVDKLLTLLESTAVDEQTKDLARTDANSLKVELQRKEPIMKRINTCWMTLMESVQGFVAIPAIPAAVEAIGKMLGY